jgi:nucleosome binding factor SPN SPT16 subunit
VNLFAPDAPGKDLLFPKAPSGQAFFLKEISFKAHKSDHLSGLAKTIRDHLKKMKMRLDHSIVPSDASGMLQLDRAKNTSLEGVTIRPSISTKRTQGSLQVHYNGFRFVAQNGTKVDLLFDNIKNAFFQPCEDELVVLLHLAF